ncbi:24652_t:CDS:2 [Gigaspora rosea]|nr:24652_t:CDS:2 [Gigaspora rosea]
MSKIPEIISKPEIEQYKQFLDFRKVNNSLASLKSSFNELAILAKENKPTSIMFGILPKLNKIVVVVDHIRRRRREFQILRAFIFSAERHGAEIFYVDSSSGKLHAKRGLCCGKLTTEGRSPLGLYSLILPLEIILNNTNLELITSRIVPR